MSVGGIGRRIHKLATTTAAALSDNQSESDFMSSRPADERQESLLPRRLELV